MSKRRKYSAEFKREAVAMANQPDTPLSQVARELGINANMLGRWSRELERDGAKAFGGQGNPRDEELLSVKRELARVKRERAFFKRSGGVLREAVEVRYRMIERCRDAFPIRMMCRCLAVSPSGHYGWRERPPSPRALDNDRLLGRIRALHAESDGATGSPRIWEDLRYAGESCSLNRVARLMRADGLRGIPQRRRWKSKASGVRPGDVQNHLARDFKAAAPNTKWATDITYIPTDWGKLALPVRRA